MTCKSCNTLQPFCLKAIGNTLSHRPSTSRFSTRKWIFLAGGSDGLRVVCSWVVVWCGPVKGLWPVWGPGELWVRGCQVKVAFRRDKPRCLLWAFYFWFQRWIRAVRSQFKPIKPYTLAGPFYLTLMRMFFILTVGCLLDSARSARQGKSVLVLSVLSGIFQVVDVRPWSFCCCRPWPWPWHKTSRTLHPRHATWHTL